MRRFSGSFLRLRPFLSHSASFWRAIFLLNFQFVLDFSRRFTLLFYFNLSFLSFGLLRVSSDWQIFLLSWLIFMSFIRFTFGPSTSSFLFLSQIWLFGLFRCFSIGSTFRTLTFTCNSLCINFCRWLVLVERRVDKVVAQDSSLTSCWLWWCNFFRRYILLDVLLLTIINFLLFFFFYSLIFLFLFLELGSVAFSKSGAD